MSDLYNRIHGLCEELQISDAEACKAVQMPRSTLSNLKNGHAKKLGDEKLNSFSLFFTKSLGRRITVEYLLGEAEENQTVNDLAAGVQLAMYDGQQYEQVPEDIKQLSAAFALAKKQQDYSNHFIRTKREKHEFPIIKRIFVLFFLFFILQNMVKHCKNLIKVYAKLTLLTQKLRKSYAKVMRKLRTF